MQHHGKVNEDSCFFKRASQSCMTIAHLLFTMSMHQILSIKSQNVAYRSLHWMAAIGYH